MNLHEIAARLDARIVTAGRTEDRPIVRIVASDRISELLERAAGDTLLVSAVPAAQLVRIAELMDAPAVCALGDTVPDELLVATARGQGIALLTCPADVAGHRKQIENLLTSGKEAADRGAV